MDILLALGGLVAAMVFVALSCARSYFEKGRRQGMEEAIREMARGISSHCQLEDGGLPAITALNAIPFSKVRRPASATKPTDAYHAQLWILGDAIGEACWLKGAWCRHETEGPCRGQDPRRSVNELLQLGWLAHLGFQHMVPNYRSFEIYRFGGEADAQEAARAIGKIEAVIPAKERPIANLSVQYKNRQKLICDWWQATPDRLSA